MEPITSYDVMPSITSRLLTNFVMLNIMVIKRVNYVNDPYKYS